MSDAGTTKYKLDPTALPEGDWSRLDAMSEEERHAAALADPDAQSATEAQLAAGRRRPDVRAIRDSLGLSIEEFAARFGLSQILVGEWEGGQRHPDRTALMLLRVIAAEPDTVARVAAE